MIKACIYWLVFLALLAVIIYMLPEAIDKELQFQEHIYKQEVEWTR